MSFIPKNPLNIPEVNATPPLPMPGTRGIFAKKDGWYDIDSNGVIRKLGEGGSSPGEDTPVFEEIQAIKFTNGYSIEVKYGELYLTDSEGNEIELYTGGYDSHARNATFAQIAKSDDDGNNIVETYATKEEVSAPKQVIQLTNGFRIESRDTGLYLVAKFEDDETECQLQNRHGDVYAHYTESADFANYAGEADYASEAGLADETTRAYEDLAGRPLKGTYYEDYGDSDNLEHIIYDGVASSYGIISNSIVAYVGEGLDMTQGFTSGLYFTTPSVMPEDYSDFPDTIYFKGDGVVDGRFVPEGDTRYTIIFDFDGNLLIGYVSGIPAPSASEEGA